MDKSSRFFLIALPALMAIVVLITLAAISSNPPSQPTVVPVTTTAAEEEKIIFAPGKGTISGVILTPDGQPNSVPVSLKYRSQRWLSKSRSQSHSGTLGSQITNEFSVEVSSGHTTLIANAEGYATTWIGPFDVYADQTINDLEIVLDPGQPLTVTVQDPDGKPIPDAKLTGSSHIVRGYWGFQQAEHREAGVYEFPHVASAPYRIQGKAPNFEPTELKIEAPHDGPATLTMNYALPTTGLVLDATGQPVPDAKLMLLYKYPDHYYGGKEISRTDSQGKFRLMDLVRKHRYYGVIEAPDGRSTKFENLQAGQTDLEFRILNQPQLTGTIHGELKQTNWQTRKRSVRIKQRILLPVEDRNDSFSYSSYTPVETEDDKQTFTFRGLLTTDWELIADDVNYKHDGSQGNVHLDINLETGNVTMSNSTSVDQ